MVFLALLTIAIGVLLALSLVLVGLLEAPWPVLLVGLVVALYGLQRVLAESQAVIPLGDMDRSGQSAEPEATPRKQRRDGSTPGDDVLTYRGIRYRVSKPDDDKHCEAETLVEGTYRGQHWQRWQSTSCETEDAPSDVSEITYRGHKVIKPERKA